MLSIVLLVSSNRFFTLLKDSIPFFNGAVIAFPFESIPSTTFINVSTAITNASKLLPIALAALATALAVKLAALTAGTAFAAVTAD